MQVGPAHASTSKQARRASAAAPAPKPPAALHSQPLPGQVQFHQMLAAANAAKVPARTAFQRELDEIDGEIDSYVSEYKYQLNAPDAALCLQTAWRARAARVFFNRFMAVRNKHLARTAREFLGPLLQYVRALRHRRLLSLRRVFDEWRELYALNQVLFMKLVKKLRASVGNIKDHASPGELWQLCVAEGADPWSARLSLGSLVSNIILRQLPARTLKVYFKAWAVISSTQVAKRRAAAAVLLRMEGKRLRDLLHMMFRFWFRWAVLRASERLRIEPPLFRPQIPEWDAWLWHHKRGIELHSRIAILHRVGRRGGAGRT